MKKHLILTGLSLVSSAAFAGIFDFATSVVSGVISVSSSLSEYEYRQRKHQADLEYAQQLRLAAEARAAEEREMKAQRDAEILKTIVMLPYYSLKGSWNSSCALYKGFDKSERAAEYKDSIRAQSLKKQERLFNALPSNPTDNEIRNVADKMAEEARKAFEKKSKIYTKPSYKVDKFCFNAKHTGIVVGGIGFAGISTVAGFNYLINNSNK
jgi:hypothetical protein